MFCNFIIARDLEEEICENYLQMFFLLEILKLIVIYIYILNLYVKSIYKKMKVNSKYFNIYFHFENCLTLAHQCCI